MGTLALGPPGSVTQEKQEMDTSPFFIYVLKLTQLQGFSSSSFFFGHVIFKITLHDLFGANAADL